ncbi:outer membrane beta-barrel protein [Vibrio agarivorans]|uniref:outer membrane beta-barrel protein n=1 Tax=Vibrio agarivorans TaxID=153622 RepID=UPI0025B47142|nr:outer membrane beta-barrel protein [Vibrio agarivorans]MDN3660796.1 outer membrane beta-barrel protein [Vibrio agarivorans]
MQVTLLNKSKCALLILSTLVSGSVLARPFNYQFDKDDAQGFSPFVDAELGYNSNVTHANDNEIDSGFVTVTPGVDYTYRTGESRLSALYIADGGYYFDSSDDNYFDQYLELNGALQFNIRHRLNLIYGFYDTHEERGQGLTEGISRLVNDTIEYQQQQFLADYTFGAKQAKGQIKLHAGLETREYQNYRTIDSDTGTKYNDYELISYGGRFLYRIKSGAQAFISVQREDKQFDYAARELAKRDNISDYYAVGALWQLTGKTQGEASIGYQTKDFDDNSFEDFSGLSWRANLTWQPKQQTKFKLRTSQSAEDPDQYGGYTDETYFGLAWAQQWRDRLISTVGASWEGDDFNGGGYDGREDDLTTLLFKLRYQFSRQFSFGARYEYEDKSSNVSDIEYSQHIIGFFSQVEF